MKRWNKDTNKWESYQPALRSYPALGPELTRQLDLIQSSSDGMMRYWPARAIMRDGTTHDRVYFANAAEFIKVWGVWPGDDSAKTEISIDDVATISPSSARFAAPVC